MAIPVHCDYFIDLRDIVAAKLTAEGFKVEATENTEAVLVRFLNVHQRRVVARPRSVQWSKELRAREASLAANLRRALANIEQSSVKGEDLNPYLSRQLVKKKDADSNDLQFNDWGMKHMHLGEVFEAPGVIKGTKELLFVMVRNEVLYFIEVGEHGDWADDRLFAIVETNWPELLAHAACSEDVTDADIFTPDQRLRLRKKFITLTVGPSGRAYTPVGGGQATSGLNLEVRRRADQILNRLRTLEKAHKVQGAEIGAMFAQQAGNMPTELHLKLHGIEADDAVVIVETQTGIRIVSARCGRCELSVEGCNLTVERFRSAIGDAGWRKEAQGLWLCPNCAAQQPQPAA